MTDRTTPEVEKLRETYAGFDPRRLQTDLAVARDELSRAARLDARLLADARLAARKGNAPLARSLVRRMTPVKARRDALCQRIEHLSQRLLWQATFGQEPLTPEPNPLTDASQTLPDYPRVLAREFART